MSSENGPNRLREYRLKAGLVQEDLADLVGVRATTISRLERGEAGPSFPLARNLARVLGATVDELFGEPERVA